MINLNKQNQIEKEKNIASNIGKSWENQQENVVVVWKDGSHKVVNSNESWEFENDNDWLVTIMLK